ncbi:chloramphenicol phosphotransferase CPT family protein [Barrientosiimonas endolithica]|uniref:chloramphenicol phosphotransferase CPT family protein n=1 Tax=Barrientosiimonas endolithica TaxID=1535208 RepID=UPI00259B9BB8|nr:AAA family ATPase [Barrientosiimonas endolithica]
MTPAYVPDRAGRLVLLNGPSSVGKSSVARAFADAQPTPWVVFPVDLLHAQRSRPDLTAPRDDMDEESWQRLFRRTRAGYHRALAGLLEAGLDVVGDHVLSEPWRIADLVEVLADADVLLVHLTAEPEILAARERERGDREPGVALAQRDLVYAHGEHDLEVDTTRRSPEQVAAEIARLLAAPPASRAFDRLRRG